MILFFWLFLLYKLAQETLPPLGHGERAPAAWPLPPALRGTARKVAAAAGGVAAGGVASGGAGSGASVDIHTIPLNTPPLFKSGMIMENAAAFAVNEQLKRIFPSNVEEGETMTAAEMTKGIMLGTITGVATALVLCPAEVIKTKTQVAIANFKGGGKAPNEFSILRKVLSRQGVSGLFTGLEVCSPAQARACACARARASACVHRHQPTRALTGAGVSRWAVLRSILWVVRGVSAPAQEPRRTAR